MNRTQKRRAWTTRNLSLWTAGNGAFCPWCGEEVWIGDDCTDKHWGTHRPQNAAEAGEQIAAAIGRGEFRVGGEEK